MINNKTGYGSKNIIPKTFDRLWSPVTDDNIALNYCRKLSDP